VAWPLLGTPPAVGPLFQLLGLYTGAAAVLWRFSAPREPAIDPAVMVLVAALGLGVFALASASLLLGQLAVALGAAMAGFALWNWPRSRFSFGAAGVLGALLPLGLLAALTLLLTQARAWALAPLLLVFLADLPARRLAARAARGADALGPVLLLLLAALPAAAAVGLALLGSGGGTDDPYYR
jgi:hypothetical protein